MKYKLSHILQNPSLILKYIRKKLRIHNSKEYVGEVKNRSDSENGLYVSAVQKAVRSYKSFSSFKKNLDYQAILEHVSKEQGERYLEIIKKDSPSLLMEIELFKDNDLVGDPAVFEYPDIGAISPTTLRYVKVASDLMKLFGNQIGERIVEIGAGYGGQALINDRIFKIKEYELLDLPPVLNLVSKYLDSHILNCAYKISTLNQKTGDDKYDLIISNYAFSELPSQLQIKYIEKVISKCKKGYLTMNSGLSRAGRSTNKLTIEQLRDQLPTFEMLPEDPITSPDNYIIIWGHKRSDTN